MTNNGLSESNIELVECFIKNNEHNTICPYLSYNDIEGAQYFYDQIKQMPVTSYTLFASNANGYTSYGFYKSKENKIYIIEAFINNILSYYDINCSFIQV